jgi:hypothetical protein
MKENPDLLSLRLKHPHVSQSDFLLGIVASKIEAIQVMMVERLCPDVASKQAAFSQLDSDSIRMLEHYLVFLATPKPSAESGLSEPPNPECN